VSKMRIKKYVAESMPEALKQVKADLGANAVILNTRTLRKSSRLGLGGKGQVEVTAAVDAGAVSGKRPAKKIQRPASASSPAKKALPSKPIPRPSSTDPLSAPDPQWADRLSRQIKHLETAIKGGQPGGSQMFLPGALAPLSEQLHKAGLAESLIQGVLEQVMLDPGEQGLKTLAPLQERAAELVSRWCPDPAPTRLGKGVRSVVALVGPAGVGKTTAAARIGAHFSELGSRVVLVAADTDRVGGLEQIRAYAAILNIPVEVVYTPEELGDLIRERKDVDLMLIDTAGAGPLDTDVHARLGELMKEAAPNEIHLTLGASTGVAQMRDVAKTFGSLGVNRLLLTKLDETARLGAACSLAVESKLPLSYMTNGRAVPGDLQPGDPRLLVQNLFERVDDGT
jgi:flagellar biosynthesis protein FlhF